MSILSVAELRKAFDTERITQLASDYDEGQQRPVYDESIVESALSQAEFFVKAALSKQYSTTQLESDKFIERITADIAMYYMEFRRNQFTSAVERAFKRALLYIRKLEEGSYKLSDVDQLLPSGNTEEPLEALRGGEGLFPLTDNERKNLYQ